MLINSYKEQLDTSARHFNVYLNNNPTPLELTGMVTGMPYIPETTNPQFSACGHGNTETTIDISRVQVYSPTGGMYEEAGGSKMYFDFKFTNYFYCR